MKTSMYLVFLVSILFSCGKKESSNLSAEKGQYELNVTSKKATGLANVVEISGKTYLSPIVDCNVKYTSITEPYVHGGLGIFMNTKSPKYSSHAHLFIKTSDVPKLPPSKKLTTGPVIAGSSITGEEKAFYIAGNHNELGILVIENLSTLIYALSKERYKEKTLIKIKTDPMLTKVEHLQYEFYKTPVTPDGAKESDQFEKVSEAACEGPFL